MAANAQNIIISAGWYLYYDGTQYRLTHQSGGETVDHGSAPTLQSALNLYLDQRTIAEYIGQTSPVSLAAAFAKRNGYGEALASGRIGCIYQSVQWGEGL